MKTKGETLPFMYLKEKESLFDMEFPRFSDEPGSLSNLSQLIGTVR